MQKRRLRATWLPSSVTIFCAWCYSAMTEMSLGQAQNTGRATLRCKFCGGHNSLPSDLLAQAQNVPADADPDNPPGRAEAWERLVGNQPLKRAMEIAIAGHLTLVYVGHPDYGWGEVEDIMGEWATIIQRCPCGDYFRYDGVSCSCKYDEVEAHRKSRRFQEALDSDLIVEAMAPSADDYWDTGEPYLSVLARIQSVRLSQDLGLLAQPRFAYHEEVNGRYTIDSQSFRLLNDARKKWELTPQRLLSVQRVAHTIASLEESKVVEARHMAEALLFKAPLQDP